MQKESLQANRIKEEIKQIVKTEMTASLSDWEKYAKCRVEETVAKTKLEFSATTKEIEKQREDMKIQGIWRKIFFWATPVMLFIDTLLLIIFMS